MKSSIAMDRHQNSTSAPTLEDTGPKIFKLNVNCFETIFDYLSLDDVNVLSQTCKLMHKVAGHILRTKYPFLCVFIDEFGDCISDRYGKQVILNTLKEYIEAVTIVTDINIMSLSQWHQFKSIKYLCFSSTTFSDAETMESIKMVLGDVNALELMGCEFQSIGLFQRLLELCQNMKHLAIRNSLDYDDTAWLLQEYPKLEHLAILPLYNEKVNEMDTFFKRNPNVRTFMVDSDFLWINCMAMMQVKLGELYIYLSNDFCYEYNDSKMNEYFSMLNEWHANGVFKRLHIIGEFQQQIIDKLVTVNGLVGIKSTTLSVDTNFAPLVNLEILHFDHITSEIVDMTPLAEHLKQLKEISFLDADFDTILLFIRHSPKLKRIIIKYMESDDECNELLAFNGERKKLCETMGDVSKVTIYTSEMHYLKIRMKSVTMYLNLVEIRPFEQYDSTLFYNY